MIEWGYQITARRFSLTAQAAYGIHLIEGCRKADELGKRTGKFVPYNPPTYEEFITRRKNPFRWVHTNDKG